MPDTAHHSANAESLFTAKSLLFRQQQNIGQARLIGPPHLTTIVILLAVILVTAMIFLTRFDYVRKQSVPGFLEYSVTTKRLYPERSGKIERLNVRPGDVVNAGDILAVVSSDLPQQVEYGRNAMADFERLIVHQHQAREDFTADNKILLKKMQAQIDALTTAGTLQQEMINIQQLKEDQAGQIRKASLALLQAGQISPLNFSEREERWHSIRQATTELRSTLANLHAQKIQLQITVANNAVTQRVGLLPMNAEIVRLEQSRNNYQREIRQELIAPLAGRIATLLHEPGEHVSPDMPILTLEPNTGILQAKLMIASHAIGFIRPGQAVNLLYDAFPHQQFGSYPGQVVDVSRHPLTALDQTSLPRGAPPVYLATITLNEHHITAYGKAIRLREGMTLKADILLESRSLMAWLFEPLFIMRGRGSS